MTEHETVVAIRPAWSRPPFAPGHTLSMTHGAWSERRISPLARQLLDEVVAEAEREGSPVAYLADPTYRPALRGWARVEARLELLHVWLDDQAGEGTGDLDAEGEVRGAADLATRLETQAQKARERLGLDPMARARLGRDLSAGQLDLARLLAGLTNDDDEEGDDDAQDT